MTARMRVTALPAAIAVLAIAAATAFGQSNAIGTVAGTGGEAIPLAGRITAIADVFDALTSERPYKRAWSLEEALAEIRDQSGRHFDPDLVDVFLQIAGHEPARVPVS